MKKGTLFLLCILTVVSAGIFGEGQEEAAAGKIKVGLSFAEFEVERWSREKDRMTDLALNAGADEVVYQVANNDANLQNSQIENMVTQGVNVIIIVAVDGEACATAVEQAAEGDKIRPVIPKIWETLAAHE